MGRLYRFCTFANSPPYIINQHSHFSCSQPITDQLDGKDGTLIWYKLLTLWGCTLIMSSAQGGNGLMLGELHVGTQFGAGITDNIWTICLKISDHFGPFWAIFGHFRQFQEQFSHFLVILLAIFCQFMSGNLVLVFLASFDPFT